MLKLGRRETGCFNFVMLFLYFVCCGNATSYSKHAFHIVSHGTDFGIEIWLVSGETLLQEKNSTGET